MKTINSHSWVRFSYGTVKYENDQIKYDTENLADPQQEEDVPTSSGVVAARSKAKAKLQPRESTGATTIPSNVEGLNPALQIHEQKTTSNCV